MTGYRNWNGKKSSRRSRNYKEAGRAAKEAKELRRRARRRRRSSPHCQNRGPRRRRPSMRVIKRDEARAALDAVAREPTSSCCGRFVESPRPEAVPARVVGQTGLRLDAPRRPGERELATLDARCADLKGRAASGRGGVVGLGGVAERCCEEEAPASPRREEPPPRGGPPEAAEAKALAARLAALERAIEAAVEAEDYERADELNTAATAARGAGRAGNARCRTQRALRAIAPAAPSPGDDARPRFALFSWSLGEQGPPPRRGPGTRPCPRVLGRSPSASDTRFPPRDRRRLSFADMRKGLHNHQWSTGPRKASRVLLHEVLLVPSVRARYFFGKFLPPPLRRGRTLFSLRPAMRPRPFPTVSGSARGAAS